MPSMPTMSTLSIATTIVPFMRLRAVPLVLFDLDPVAIDGDVLLIVPKEWLGIA